MSQGVEWAVHACTVLAPLGPEKVLSLAALADFHGIGTTYMAKQMQLLSRAGLVATTRGATGGYTLARSASEISLYDIVRAIEGPAPLFRCTEIRQQGPCGKRSADCRAPCGIAAAFAKAEAAWRDCLKAVSVADMVSDAAAASSSAEISAAVEWLGLKATTRPGKRML
ncbi:RrF2 family transcriptional regulator [Qipengyuania gelatinilytica]|uniref:Rrf2 family transcriptional regulator n=1 Tax=Qipengyuania gelatinilytica TaxID=2867231 RepID=A0ABX9A416_9SPHN|nr:Rrf2 family transcriptional regulator [Qipengyuania gelatinilytica]QZD96015.1 Rrf2 family transcriptional regulator [Qipengyuania gelatinilytica]